MVAVGAHKGGSVRAQAGACGIKAPIEAGGLWAEGLEAAPTQQGVDLGGGDLTETRARGCTLPEKATGTAGSPYRNREVSAGAGGSPCRK